MIRFNFREIWERYIYYSSTTTNITHKKDYVKGWEDCLKYLAENFNVDIVVDKE